MRRFDVRKAWFGALSLALFLAAACTVYSPVTGVDVAAGKAVRVNLSDVGAARLAPTIGQRARRLQGTLRSTTDSTIVMALETVSRESGINDSYGGSDITLARRDVQSVEEVRTSVPRSLLTTGALVAGAFLVAKGAGQSSSGNPGGPPPPGK